jgi:DNA-binding NarL/FixJ family response regulator
MKRSPAPEASVTPIRRALGVVLVDPLPVVLGGLQRLIDDQPDLEVLATSTDGDAALAAVARIRRSRVVTIVGLGIEGIHDAAWTIRAIRELVPSHTVLAMGANAEPAAVSHALFVGADGFIDKNVPIEDFVGAVRRAAKGEMVITGPELATLGEIATVLDRRRDLDARLTSRELQVLTVAAEGLTARQIAERLGVRERTVTTHLGRIYGKLGVGNRLAAIRSATRSGLVAVGATE